MSPASATGRSSPSKKAKRMEGSSRTQGGGGGGVWGVGGGGGGGVVGGVRLYLFLGEKGFSALYSPSEQRFTSEVRREGGCLSTKKVFG